MRGQPEPLLFLAQSGSADGHLRAELWAAYATR